MSQALSLNNAETLTTIATVAGISRTPNDWDDTIKQDVRVAIRRGLRRFYTPQPLPNSTIHQWRFLERRFMVATSTAYSTGTISATGGIVTLTGGSWPSWSLDGLLRVGNQTYYITGVDGVDRTINNNTVEIAAATTFTLYRYRYPLPDDFGEFIGQVTYSNGAYTYCMLNVDDEEIRIRYGANFLTGRTRLYSIFAGSDTDTARWYFSFWPTFDADASIIGVYRVSPLDKLDATDILESPTVIQVDAVHAETLMASILASVDEIFNDRNNGIYHDLFITRLAASIAHDRHVQGARLYEWNTV